MPTHLPQSTLAPRFASAALGFLILLAAVPAPFAAQDARRPIELADYYRLKSVGSPALSTDGSRVAFVMTTVLEDENRRHSEVWIASADGEGEPTRLTSPSFSSSSPAWTPDGAHLYFSSRRPGPDGEASGGPWFLRDGRGRGRGLPDRRTGRLARVQPRRTLDRVHAGRAARRNPAPGQLRLRLRAPHRRALRRTRLRLDELPLRPARATFPTPRDPWATPPREIFVLPAAGGEARQVTELGFNASGLAWSPDGTRIAFTAGRPPARRAPATSAPTSGW